MTYGFGDASEAVLSRLATAAAYLAEGDRARTGEALSAALASMLNSLVASAHAQQLQVPKEIAEFTSLPLDLMD